MVRASLIAIVPVALGLSTGDPLGKSIELLDGMAGKIQKEDDVEAAQYKEFFEWCDDAAKNAQFDIKSAKPVPEEHAATIGKASATITSSASKVEELSASIASDTADLQKATELRKKEVGIFEQSEAELTDTIDTMERAVNVLERKQTQDPASFAQLKGSNTQKIAQALSAIVDAATFNLRDKNKLMSMLQDNEDDDALGAPEEQKYESGRQGSIVDVLNDMKDKAEDELDELRKAEVNSKHNFNMLKQALEDNVAADSSDLAKHKSAKSEAEETKASAEGDLVQAKKVLAEAQSELASLSANCLQTAADHEASTASRKEELKVIAEAKKVISDGTSGAALSTAGSRVGYSFLQTRDDLHHAEMVAVLKSMAKKMHSTALSQLASKVDTMLKYKMANKEDIFAKIRENIEEMIAKLEKEAEDDATEKVYCDEEMPKPEAKRVELEADIAKFSARVDKATAKSADLKADVKDVQAQLAVLAREQAELDRIRGEQSAEFKQIKQDLEEGITAVAHALTVLRDYYGAGATPELVQTDWQSEAVAPSMMQQPSMPNKVRTKADGQFGAATGVIHLLETCESDFSENLAKSEAEEADSDADYDKITQENKLAKVGKDQDVKYKTAEFKGLDKTVAEISGDKSTASGELDAVMEYFGKLKQRCVAKPNSYETRKARREEQIAQLKEGLQAFEDQEPAFMQRKMRAAKHRFLGM